MIETQIQQESITFSPDLTCDDAWATYWLRQVTARLRREICWCWHERGVLPKSNSGVLPPLVDNATASLDMSRYFDRKKKFFSTDPTARYLTEQLESRAPPAEINYLQGSFGWVINELKLDDAATFMLALGLAVAFDNAMASVISVCQNDPTKSQPNLALAQKLWDNPEQILKLGHPTHPIFAYGLLQPVGQPSQQYAVIDWESPIVVPSLVASQLLFPKSDPPAVLSSISFEGNEEIALTAKVRLVAARLNSKREEKLRVVPVRGPRGSSHSEVVRGICKLTDRDIVELKTDPDFLENSHFLNSVATFCWLKAVDLFLGIDMVSVRSDHHHGATATVLPLHSIPMTIFIAMTEQSQTAQIPGHLLLPVVEVPGLSYQERTAHWKKVLGAKSSGLDPVIAEFSRRFRYEKETINAICEGLKAGNKSISENKFIEACRSEIELNMGDLAQKVVPRFLDEKLILPRKHHLQFQEVVKAMKSLTKVHYEWGTAKVWNESGISVLFAGPPGSGKTMGAEMLAIELELPLYRIDLSQVVNKYIGETEKNLKRLFDVADISDTILFFDEADSLFGRRTEVKDAHDRYANLEISYLLDRMERFKGLAILATNRKKDIDEAFLRRLRYIIDFPLPGVEQRKKIWRQVIPKAVRDSSKINFDFLGNQFPLAGGHIRSIIFNACLQCANSSNGHSENLLTMEHIIIAVKREYDKLNRSISLEQFGPYAEVIEELERKDEKH